MVQYIQSIDSTATVISANVVGSATVVQSANKVNSATSTTYVYNKGRLYIEGAAYVLVLSQEDFDALAKKDLNTFYFILDPDFSPVINTEGECDTSLFLELVLDIIGEDSDIPLILASAVNISVSENTLIILTTAASVNNGNLVLG